MGLVLPTKFRQTSDEARVQFFIKSAGGKWFKLMELYCKCDIKVTHFLSLSYTLSPHLQLLLLLLGNLAEEPINLLSITIGYVLYDGRS